jgi:hypothetical protein
MSSAHVQRRRCVYVQALNSSIDMHPPQITHEGKKLRAFFDSSCTDGKGFKSAQGMLTLTHEAMQVDTNWARKRPH